jgi:microcin C transport system permease protein
MSRAVHPEAADAAVATAAPAAPARWQSPNRRAWARFKRNRLGYVSL